MATNTKPTPAPNGLDIQLRHNIYDPNDPRAKACGGVGCPEVVDKGELEAKTFGYDKTPGRKITTKTMNADGTYKVTSSYATETWVEDAQSYKIENKETVATRYPPRESNQDQVSKYFQDEQEVKDSKADLDNVITAKQDSNIYLMKNGGTSADSAINQAGSPIKALLKLANKADKKTYISKRDIYPVVSPGSALVQYPSSTEYSADYYRFGLYNPLESKWEVPKKEFVPIVNDKVPSSIRVIGKPSDTNKTGDLIPAYTKFILESVQESHTERSQIVETFGDFYVFMFGERPPVYNFTGQLVNSKNTNWVTDFMYMYNEFLRGTRCVERNARILLTYGGRQIEGLMLNTSSQTNAAVDGAVSFGFSVVVFERKYYNFSQDMGFFTSDQSHYEEDSTFRKALGIIAPPDGKGTSKKGISDMVNEAAGVAKGGSAAGAIENIGNFREQVV